MKTHTLNPAKTITTEELDEKFDNGEDILQYLDLENTSVSVRFLMPIKLQKKLLDKAKKQNKTLEELITSILEANKE